MFGTRSLEYQFSLGYMYNLQDKNIDHNAKFFPITIVNSQDFCFFFHECKKKKSPKTQPLVHAVGGGNR